MTKSLNQLIVLKSITAPLTTVVLQMLGIGFYITFVSLKMDQLGYDEWLIGLVQSANYAGVLVGATQAHRIVQRVGHIRAYAACACLGTATIIIQALTYDPSVWMLMRFVMGICMSVYYLVTESWFLSTATVRTRGSILAFYMIAYYLAQALSQFVLDLVDLSSAAPFLLSCLFGALSAVPLLLTSTLSPEHGHLSDYSVRKLFRQSPLGLSACVISGLVLSALLSFAPLFAVDAGISVSVMISIIIIGGVVFQWPVGALSDRMDRRLILLAVSLLTIVPALGMIMLPRQDLVVLSLAFVLGGFTFTVYPVAITQVCDRLDAKDVTRGAGILIVAYGLGAVLGPLLAPPFIEGSQLSGLFVYVIVLSLLQAAIALVVIARREAVDEEDRSEFIPLAAATPITQELDPRIDEDPS